MPRTLPQESSYYEDDTSSSVTDSTDDFTDDEWGLVEAGEPGLVASPGLKDKTLGALATWLQPGSYLVLGRILANGVLYVTILTTVALQGRKCARGVVGVKNGLVELPKVIKEVSKSGGEYSTKSMLHPPPAIHTSAHSPSDPPSLDTR